jgi:hypothetical protein
VAALARAKLLQCCELREVPHHAECCRAAAHPARGEEPARQTPAETTSGLPEGPGLPEAEETASNTGQKEPFIWPLGDHLTEDQKSQLRELLDEHIDFFAFNMNDMGQVKNETFRIPVTDNTPIFRRQYRLAEAEKKILKEQVEERLEAGFIRPSMSE